MAVLANYNPTLLDLAQRQDPDGSVAQVVEIMNQQNDILDEMSWSMGNLTTGHKATIRTGIPRPTWIKLNEGSIPQKSTTAQVEFSCGRMQNYSEVDVELIKLNNNEEAWRMSEEAPFIEGFNQELAETLFYGNESAGAPEEFTGLAAYYNDLAAESADNILDAGGTGDDNASLWLVVWSLSTVFGIVPKGTTAGLEVRNLGEVTVENAGGVTGARMQAERTHYQQRAGLVVKDWRYAVRIANIDKSELTKTYTAGAFSSGADLTDLMFQAMRLVPNLNMGRAAFYMSRDIATWVARQTAAKGQNGLITVDPMSGDNSVSGSKKFTERFHGIPMRRCDVLAADEAQVQ
jgi:hypothetical protein